VSLLLRKVFPKHVIYPKINQHIPFEFKRIVSFSCLSLSYFWLMSELKNQPLVYIGIIMLVLHFEKQSCGLQAFRSNKLNKRSNILHAFLFMKYPCGMLLCRARKFPSIFLGQFELK